MSGVRVGMGVTWMSMEVDVGLGVRDGRGGLDRRDGYDWYGRGERGETVGCERHVDAIDHDPGESEARKKTEGRGMSLSLSPSQSALEAQSQR